MEAPARRYRRLIDVSSRHGIFSNINMYSKHINNRNHSHL